MKLSCCLVTALVLFFLFKVDLLWQMTSYRNVLKSRWEEAKKSEIWSRQLVMTLIHNYTCGECILNKILNWMRKNVKHFVLTILQFYYFFNLKLPTLISVLPRSLLKRFRWYLVREATFLFMMGIFDLFVRFWNKTMILCPPLSHSRIRRTTRDPPQISNIRLSFS